LGEIARARRLGRTRDRPGLVRRERDMALGWMHACDARTGSGRLAFAVALSPFVWACVRIVHCLCLYFC
jgi:hypothetical protein